MGTKIGRRHGTAWLAGLLLLFGAGTPARALPLVDLDFGVKGGVNMGLLLVEEKFANGLVEDYYDGDDAFGVGGGGGIYGELRLLDYVGLELDLLFSRDQVTRTESWDLGDARLELDHTSWANNLRIPVLLKGFLPLGPVRLSLGAGLEYVHTLDHGYDIVEQRKLAEDRGLAEYRSSHHSAAKDCLFLTGQLELAIDLVFLTIPIDLRVGKNLSQTDTFEDRYDYELERVGGGYQITERTIQAIYSWDFRLLTGVAWSF